MNIYNIDGLPGVTVSGKQAGESEIILKTAKRGRMTFYSSNAYNVYFNNETNLQLPADVTVGTGYVNMNTNEYIHFLINEYTPLDNDLVLENRNDKLNLYLIHKVDITEENNTYQFSFKETKDNKEHTYIYNLKLFDTLALSSFSPDTLDLNISISSVDTEIPEWPGYYKLSYINRKSEMLFKSYKKDDNGNPFNANLNCSKFSYTDEQNSIIPTPKSQGVTFSYYEEHDNYVNYVKTLFDYKSCDDSNSIYFKSLVNNIEEPLHVTKYVSNKISDFNFKGFCIKLCIKDTNTHKPINDKININEITINCDMLNTYDIDLNTLSQYGYDAASLEEDNIILKSNENTPEIHPYGIVDRQYGIRYRKNYVFNDIKCENGVVSLFIDKNKSALSFLEKNDNTPTYYSLSPIYASINVPSKAGNIYANSVFLLNKLSFLREYTSNDMYVCEFEVYLNYDDSLITSDEHVTDINISNGFLVNYTYNFGDLPYFDTSKISEKDYSDHSINLIQTIDDKESVSKLPIFGLNDNEQVNDVIEKAEVNKVNATITSFTMSSALSANELDKYKIIAELDNHNSNVFASITSSCLSDKWIKSNEKKNEHINGDSSLFDRNLNFNNENIFPCTFVIKDFNDKFINNVFNKTINLPIGVASNCQIKLLAYYKKSINNITKIYLGETSVSETYTR